MNPKIRIAPLVLVSVLAVGNIYADIWSWTEIPHVAVGGGYASYLYISNPLGITPGPNVWVHFYQNDGTPWFVNVEGVGRVSSFSFTLNAFQEKAFVLTGGGNTEGGWAEVSNEGIGRIDASLRFVVGDRSADPVDAVGILPSRPNKSWTVTIDKQKATEYVGVAVANPWSNLSLDVYFDFYQGTNRVPGTTSVRKTLPPDGHLAIFVHELFPGVTFNGTGTLRVSCSTGGFAATALRLDGSQFSSLPAHEGTQFWSWTYTTASGTVYEGTWSWRLLDGDSFIGLEQDSWNDYGVEIQGMLANNYFIAGWWWTEDNGTNGTQLFQGKPGREGDKDVINGKLSSVREDGALEYSCTFKATRLY